MHFNMIACINGLTPFMQLKAYSHQEQKKKIKTYNDNVFNNNNKLLLLLLLLSSQCLLEKSYFNTE